LYIQAERHEAKIKCMENNSANQPRTNTYNGRNRYGNVLLR
jgi:hypothetical protein